MTVRSDWPRVLVVTKYPFNPRDGGGIALTNYFHGWPADRLAQAYLGGPHGEADTSVCRSHYILSHREIVRPWPLPLYDRLKSRQGALPTVHSQGNFQRKFLKSRFKEAGVKVKHGVSARLRKYGFLFPIDCRVSAELAEFIARFQPQILFTTLGDLSYIRLARTLSEEFDIPLALQICDDWMSDQYLLGPFAKIMRAKLDSELRELFERASVRFSICRTMSDAYLERYGKSFEPLPVPVEFGVWNRSDKRVEREDDALVVLYAGSIHGFGQLNGLTDISRAVERLNGQGVKVRFHILTPPEFILRHGRHFKATGCRLMPYETRDELIRHVKEADLLTIPINFDKDSLRFIRYSMPAKIAAYMASGTPLLVYGPQEVPPVIEARRDGFAYCVTERNPEKLTAALRRLLGDDRLRRGVSKRAMELARERYDIVRVSASFRRGLSEACEGHEKARNGGGDFV